MKQTLSLDSTVNNATGMNGWRLWVIGRAPDSATLVSPIARHLHAAKITLPHDGDFQAFCDRGHIPPHPDCECGVYFIGDAHSMLEWADRFGFLKTPHCALTNGTGAGPFLRSTYRDLGGIPLPATSLRAARFRATAILAAGEGRGLTRYSVPVYRGPLTLAKMREVERIHLVDKDRTSAEALIKAKVTADRTRPEPG
ncbi:hypothetical protein [Mycolicibacterium hippocampi]|uniref:hypothetical protein n=1 Tax=Mycolicibacterium hippocampi TaxID=659824 RepID=UPI003510ECAC